MRTVTHEMPVTELTNCFPDSKVLAANQFEAVANWLPRGTKSKRKTYCQMDGRSLGNGSTIANRSNALASRKSNRMKTKGNPARCWATRSGGLAWWNARNRHTAFPSCPPRSQTKFAILKTMLPCSWPQQSRTENQLMHSSRRPRSAFTADSSPPTE
ncbi:hypothetical protein Q31a_41990 [Aureliella helgolandensis]|uniref:Uncharacterized protein n=1 Tax=Aureliella helgolandensis TaxID=2527968 RepID=A0A518GB78_9BACT|nr:hypothetical protein Q31a_41990 [Aureliella helgolandensis]